MENLKKSILHHQKLARISSNILIAVGLGLVSHYIIQQEWLTAGFILFLNIFIYVSKIKMNDAFNVLLSKVDNKNP